MVEPISTHVVPSGYEIADYGKGRGGGYKIDGEKVVGVTTALGIIDGGKSGGMAWSAARIWLKGVCSLLNEDKPVWLETPEEYEAELKSRKLLHIHQWGAKTDMGSVVHDCLEKLCVNEYPTLSTFPEDTRPYVSAICSWWADNDPKVIESEMIVGSRLHSYAGRFDLLYEAHDGRRVLADLKTSRDVQPTHLIQLAAYRNALVECGYPDVDRMEVIHVKPDGGYTVVESKATAEDFLAVLDAYVRFNGVKDNLKRAA